jgi:rhodanese-related sulfurtransferase
MVGRVRMPEGKSEKNPPVHATPAHGYAGDVTSEEAWRLLAEDPKAALVDVRTMAEWTYVGTPDLSSIGKRPLLIEWQTFPDRNINPEFLGNVAQALPDKDAPILFLCRSGARSAAAAAMAAARGYARCYNVADGFEGDPDRQRHRGTSNGWKASGLPWVQT